MNKLVKLIVTNMCGKDSVYQAPEVRAEQTLYAVWPHITIATLRTASKELKDGGHVEAAEQLTKAADETEAMLEDAA